MTREEISCATMADVIDIFEVEKFPAIPENHYRSVLPNEFRQIAVSGIGEEVYEVRFVSNCSMLLCVERFLFVF